MAQSALFSQFDLSEDENREFEPDLRRLLELDAHVREKLLERLPRWFVLRIGDALAREFAEQFGVPQSTVLGTLRCYDFFVRNLLHDNNDDTIEQWVTDLTAMLGLHKEESEQLRSALAPLGTLPLEEVAGQLARRQPGVLPEFDAIETTVELRAVFGRSFILGERLSSYEPEVRDLVPIVSMAMSTDTQEHLRVQLHVDDLRLVVDKLQAALREAEALEAMVPRMQRALDSERA
ncbi:MAG: hypothetical protein AAGF11_51360 [Myxococcota bacterium]